MKDFLKLENLGGDFKLLHQSVRSGKPTTAFSLALGAKIHIASSLNNFVLFITIDNITAQDCYEKFKGFCGERAVLIPENDDVLLHRSAYSGENTAKRINAITKIITNQADVAVISADGLIQHFTSVQNFKNSLLHLKENKEYSIESVIEKLISGGYSRLEMAEIGGTFSLRGDILDIYPISFNNPVRISFFDNTIETIKFFDATTMESMEKVESIIVPPSSDLIINNDEKIKVINKLQKTNAEGHLRDIIDEVLFRLESTSSDSTLVWLLPFLDNLSSIFDYIPIDSVVIFDEPKLLDDKLSLITKEHFGRVKSLSEGNVLPIHKNSIIKKESLYSESKVFKRLAFQQLTSINPIFKSEKQFAFRSHPLNKYYLDNSSLVVDLKNFNYNGYSVVLCCGDLNKANSVANSLKQNDIMVYVADDLIGGTIASTLDIRTGFIYHSAKLVVIGIEELFGKKRERSISIKPKKDFKPIKEGDYVVHSVHGIGFCQGTEKIQANDIFKDYVVLTYREGDKLYVPIDQMDMLTRFSGVETPRLNKIGGKEFKRTKDKVKRSVKKLAIDLLQLYAERESQRGFKYSNDTVWQKEFEDKFEFDLTDDQISAVYDIKTDMEKGKVMDRLICGDVGYGKTEVAFRAIFKTIIDNKQSAILAPTTILAKQHFNTLQARLEGFGISCRLLSRLQTASETKEILEGLENGIISIVVATHRLISKDVKFYDLGLLVLDEEQRFGVEHKERLKKSKTDLNVLTLTATPIPRTLNMALSGIRDISLLETPPKNRLPIQNYIVEYTDALLIDAIKREVNRGGQVFILYNYVETINDFAKKVSNLMDDKVKILVAHGQMANAELDLTITKFYEKKADVLIATTIIENGIDLPDANTLIVFDADKFGLAQLYQLRGRIGRSGALAHAYFTTRFGKVLTDSAVKRLSALTEYSEFGSGFKIAMRDLEIRGAGKLLGAEQHGHIEKVGYELYTKILHESISEIKSGYIDKERDIEIKIDANAYVDENYVSKNDKIRIYKQISKVRTLTEQENLINSLTEVYGKPQQALVNLIDIALIKSLAMNFEITKIVLNNKGAGFAFENAEIFKNENLLNAVNKMGKDVVLTATIPPQLLFNSKGKKPEQVLELMKNFLFIAHEKGL